MDFPHQNRKNSTNCQTSIQSNLTFNGNFGNRHHETRNWYLRRWANCFEYPWLTDYLRRQTTTACTPQDTLHRYLIGHGRSCGKPKRVDKSMLRSTVLIVLNSLFLFVFFWGENDKVWMTLLSFLTIISAHHFSPEHILRASFKINMVIC